MSTQSRDKRIPTPFSSMPWRVIKDGDRIVDADGNTICHLQATVNGPLLAAAPRLLEALQKMVEGVMKDYTLFPDADGLQEIEAATGAISLLRELGIEITKPCP